MSEPTKASTTPFFADVEAGNTYFWCACGLSQKQPFCDGSHSSTDFTPVKFEATETKKVSLCGCKHSQNTPFCDVSYSTLLHLFHLVLY